MTLDLRHSLVSKPSSTVPSQLDSLDKAHRLVWGCWWTLPLLPPCPAQVLWLPSAPILTAPWHWISYKIGGERVLSPNLSLCGNLYGKTLCHVPKLLLLSFPRMFPSQCRNNFQPPQYFARNLPPTEQQTANGTRPHQSNQHKNFQHLCLYTAKSLRNCATASVPVNSSLSS